MNILAKHAKDNWFDRNFDSFESALDEGKIHANLMPGRLLIRTRCENCDEEALAIKYHGRRILVYLNGNVFENHQCPYQVGPDEGHDEPTPEEEIDWSERADIEEEMRNQTLPDDPCVRDGSGNIRAGGWHDEYPDDPYNHPDIPYVNPIRGDS